ncbi:MAG: NADP-dependent oxidoreductase [Bryobacteraceae bacterium]
MNRQVLFAARPKGLPKESDFRLAEAPVPEPGEGEFRVRNSFVSVDPYMRGRMNDSKSYVAPFQIDAVIESGAVGYVDVSHNPKFPAGAAVTGGFGWQEFAVSNGKGVRIVDPSIAPISTALGVLGMPGMTAYFGLLEICNPQPGETVVVSGAAGAVGSLAGQIAKIKGCRSIGIAGGDEKIRYITQDLGFDGGLNYKTEKDYVARLAELCPEGIDVYFDNVGGAITDAVLTLINKKARIALSGQISQYNAEKPEVGPRPFARLIIKQAKAEGFLVPQFADRFKEALPVIAQWIREGKVKFREEIVTGIENAPKAFIGMLQGANIGKMLVKVA